MHSPHKGGGPFKKTKNKYTSGGNQAIGCIQNVDAFSTLSKKEMAHREKTVVRGPITSLSLSRIFLGGGDVLKSD